MDRSHHRLAPIRTWAVVGATFCVVALVVPARAAASAANPWADDDGTTESSYRKAIEEGVKEYEAGHFEEARSLFRRAHHLDPNARTFRGIGMTSFEVRDYVIAVRNLAAALQDQRKPLTIEQRKETQALLDRARGFVGTFTLALSPRNARLTVDTRAPEFEADGTLLLGFGSHVLEARAPGRAAGTLMVNVRGGERRDLTLALEPVPVGGSPVRRGGAEGIGTSASPASAAKTSNRAALVWLLAGGGAALLTAGAGVYWGLQNSELNSCRNPKPGFVCTDEADIKLQRNLAAAATVVSGAAAVALAVVGILSWKSAPSAARSHAAAFTCTPSPVGVICSGVF